MRNFHHVSHTPFITYSVNAGEYVKEFNDIRQEIIEAIASAMETRLDLVINELNSIVSQGPLEDDEYEIHFVSPSEGRALASFVRFSIDVQIFEQSERGSDWVAHSMAYSYHNLNTGASVVWLHLVE